MISDISIPFGKTLKPTYEEFLKFDQFMENCEKDKSLQGTGIFKVPFYLSTLFLINPGSSS